MTARGTLGVGMTGASGQRSGGRSIRLWAERVGVVAGVEAFHVISLRASRGQEGYLTGEGTHQPNESRGRSWQTPGCANGPVEGRRPWRRFRWAECEAVEDERRKSAPRAALGGRRRVRPAVRADPARGATRRIPPWGARLEAPWVGYAVVG